MSGHAGDDLIEDTAQKFYGGDGDDTMSPSIVYFANAAADLLKGEGGDDTLYLYGTNRGDGGSDLFIFTGDDGDTRTRTASSFPTS